MTRCRAGALAVTIALGSGAATVARTSPYAGQETRDLKALSPEQVNGYLGGEGMGLALAAELNRYPGPKHVLELSEELGLSAGQKASTRTVFDEMRAAPNGSSWRSPEMTIPPTSPRITRLSWGHLEVEGHPQAFKDAKLFPGGAKEWDWRETGTQHVPGIQSADVEELLEHGAKIVVLSKGMELRLRVCPETLEYLEEQGIETHILPSKEAVRLYNELRSRAPVGALIHSTC